MFLSALISGVFALAASVPDHVNSWILFHSCLMVENSPDVFFHSHLLGSKNKCN